MWPAVTKPGIVLVPGYSIGFLSVPVGLRRVFCTTAGGALVRSSLACSISRTLDLATITSEDLGGTAYSPLTQPEREQPGAGCFKLKAET